MSSSPWLAASLVASRPRATVLSTLGGVKPGFMRADMPAATGVDPANRSATLPFGLALLGERFRALDRILALRHGDVSRIVQVAHGDLERRHVERARRHLL